MAPLILLPIGAIFIPLASLATKRSGFISAFALFLLAAAFILNFYAPFELGYASTLFVFDEMSRFFNAIFIISAFITGLFAMERFRKRETVFYSMLLAGTAAMIITASARNLIGLFMGMELLSLCFYELCALKKDAPGLESAAKLFFMSIFASALFIFGTVLIYSQTQTLDLQQFLRLGHASPAFLGGIGLLLAGLAFKMGLFPFNVWLPDVYQGAPSEITAILAASAKKAGFAAFMRLTIPLAAIGGSPGLFSDYTLLGLPKIMAILSFLTMSFGTIVSLIQNNVKRMIAYSIIAHAGFLAMAFAASTELGFIGLLFHILIHALMSLGTFLLIAYFEDHGLKEMADFDGLGKRAPLASGLLTVFLLSLTGVPPLAGFLSKFLLWSGTMEAGFTWLAVAAIVNSAISTYIYFLLLRRVWTFAPKADKAQPLTTLSWNQHIALAIPTALIIILGIYPAPILAYLRQVVASLP